MLFDGLFILHSNTMGGTSAAGTAYPSGKPPSSPPDFSGVYVAQSLVFDVMFSRSLFALVYFFFWSLYCLFIFDLRLLIAPLVSSSIS